MSETTNPDSAAIPPRATIKVPGQSGEVAPATEPSLVSKKKTARLSLDSVSAEPGAVATPVAGPGVASKTIRLAPAMTTQISSSAIPALGKALTGSFLMDEVKHKTSRIPLESVLPGAAPVASSGGADSIPKTIKVKRPTITASPVNLKPEEAAPVTQPGKNQTARVEITPDMVADTQQTQKKTIKIRRPEGVGGEAKAPSEGRAISIARAAAPEGGVAVAARDQVAKPHVAFVGIAAAALLVLCFMIYVLAAQVYPDLGLSL